MTKGKLVVETAAMRGAVLMVGGRSYVVRNQDHADVLASLMDATDNRVYKYSVKEDRQYAEYWRHYFGEMPVFSSVFYVLHRRSRRGNRFALILPTDLDKRYHVEG